MFKALIFNFQCNFQALFKLVRFFQSQFMFFETDIDMLQKQELALPASLFKHKTVKWTTEHLRLWIKDQKQHQIKSCLPVFLFLRMKLRSLWS